MKITFVLPLLLASAMPVATLAQDVGVFSDADVEAVLADPAPAVGEPSASADDCTVPLTNGRCIRIGETRGMRLHLPKKDPLSSQRPMGPTGRKAAATKAPKLVTPGHSREVPLQFKLGSFDLSPQSKANLKTLARALNSPKHHAKKIRISGHTDRSGSLDVNRRLSQQRADAAADFLASQGVERGRVETVGRAYEAPLAGFARTNPRQRRVEVVRVE